jgi:photosystem II stability/assembly factor-like uncharacterized protein
MWWVGTRKGLFAVEDSGVQGVQFRGTPVTMALVHGSQVWAAVGHGHYGPKLHRSDDGGASFVEIGSPQFAEVTGEEKGPSVSMIWSLERGRDGRLWAGTLPGGLFTSLDSGRSWQLVETLWERPERKEWVGGGADEPGIHSIGIHPDDPDDVLVGVSCGGTWRTRDGGRSWTLGGKGMKARFMPPQRQDDLTIQDPHRIVRAPSDPDVAWCQHHCGAWRSTDAGATWSELTIPPSSFGFAVAVHPRDPDTAWYVPAQNDDMRLPVEACVVVARTRDGGRSFEVLREGLPQRDAYDLVYRHALDIDDTGDRLAFGSTTGSFWTTTDGGDVWKEVSHNLPPIYVVRSGATRRAIASS